jgi:hypothetical protein
MLGVDATEPGVDAAKPGVDPIKLGGDAGKLGIDTGKRTGMPSRSREPNFFVTRAAS